MTANMSLLSTYILATVCDSALQTTHI